MPPAYSVLCTCTYVQYRKTGQACAHVKDYMITFVGGGALGANVL